jgi:hypothetical protein
VKTISKKLYLSSILVCLGIAFLLTLTIQNALLNGGIEISIFWFLFIIDILFAICGIVIFMILIYELWKIIPADYCRTTPGKAVGFLFIPLFNYYWIFQVLLGWTKDFNSYTSKNNLNVQKMPEDVALALSIVSIISTLSFIQIYAFLANFILLTIFINRSIEGVNSLARTGT